MLPEAERALTTSYLDVAQLPGALTFAYNALLKEQPPPAKPLLSLADHLDGIAAGTEAVVRYPSAPRPSKVSEAPEVALESDLDQYHFKGMSSALLDVQFDVLRIVDECAVKRTETNVNEQKLRVLVAHYGLTVTDAAIFAAAGLEGEQRQDGGAGRRREARTWEGGRWLGRGVRALCADERRRRARVLRRVQRLRDLLLGSVLELHHQQRDLR
jgi:hypothetical protein